MKAAASVVASGSRQVTLHRYSAQATLRKTRCVIQPLRRSLCAKYILRRSCLLKSLCAIYSVQIATHKSLYAKHFAQATLRKSLCESHFSQSFCVTPFAQADLCISLRASRLVQVLQQVTLRKSLYASHSASLRKSQSRRASHSVQVTLRKLRRKSLRTSHCSQGTRRKLLSAGHSAQVKLRWKFCVKYSAHESVCADRSISMRFALRKLSLSLSPASSSRSRSSQVRDAQMAQKRKLFKVSGKPTACLTLRQLPCAIHSAQP